MAKKAQKDNTGFAEAEMPMIDSGGDDSSGNFSYSLGGDLPIDSGDREEEEGSVLLSEYAELDSNEAVEDVGKRKTTKESEDDEEGTKTAGRDPFLEAYTQSGAAGDWDPAYE